MHGWNPIATAPKDGTDVLLWYPDLKQAVRIGSYNVTETIRNGKPSYKSEGWSSDVDLWGLGNKKHEPSHWMVLPGPPQ